jgi:hypothetical protein
MVKCILKTLIVLDLLGENNMMTRKDYIATAEIMKYISDKIHPAVFSKTVHDFAEMFAKDNERFDVSRFHKASGYHVPQFNSK